ncbi:MAG: SDR family NAD(P)-dependent oxidoreductase [Pirellulales bacterium]
MPPRSLAGARAIVTGASSGIGREIALALGRAGTDVLALARDESRLRELEQAFKELPGRLSYIAGDVTRDDVRHACVRRIADAFGGLDLLINNAGIGATGRFEQSDAERMQRIMEVNFFAPVELIRLAIPLLRRGRDPAIVNVTSILGRRGIPLMSEYCASKFALEGFSQSLRAELAREGIDVLVVAPGTTATDFHDHAIGSAQARSWPTQPGVPAADVAAATLRALRKRLREIIPNRRGRMLCLLQRIAPGVVDRMMSRYG